MSPTNRTLSGPKVSTPADRSGPETLESTTDASEAVERPAGRAIPTAEAAANRNTSRLEWPPDTDFSLILFSLDLIGSPRLKRVALFIPSNFDFPAARIALKFP